MQWIGALLIVPQNIIPSHHKSHLGKAMGFSIGGALL